MVNTSQAKVIIHLCSYLIVLYGLTLAIPLMFALYFRERAEIFAFLYTLIICLGTGLIGSFITRKSPRHNLDRKNGFLLILLLWVIFSLISGLPLLLNEDMHIRLVDAVFEGVSGITTTGGSVLSNIDALPRSIHYFRAQLNFVGGLGVIILAIAILPLLGVGWAEDVPVGDARPDERGARHAAAGGRGEEPLVRLPDAGGALHRGVPGGRADLV